MEISLSVIVVTLNRPDVLRVCLEHLMQHASSAKQVIVVDASRDDVTQEVVNQFSNIIYERTGSGYGHMTASRNRGLKLATGDIIAFVDDDAFVHSEWLDNLISPYLDETVGAVGGRALNNQPDEALLGVNEIGRLKPNGSLTGYFAADPGAVIEVDHMIGCNMSFRREVLDRLGGFRDDFPGTEVREESDMCLRVRALGYRILFNPAAVVDHMGAPQSVGKRFDARYVYYGERNHVAMLMRNFGLVSPIVFRYLAWSSAAASIEFARKIGGAVLRFAAAGAGLAVGIASGVWFVIRNKRGPVRRGPSRTEITAHPSEGEECDDAALQASAGAQG